MYLLVAMVFVGMLAVDAVACKRQGLHAFFANRLAAKRIYTMGDMARATLIDEDWFYREFGVDGELMIDHAWGLESCTMADIKAFRPTSNSMSSGQVLFKPYPYQEAETVVREMAELLVYDMMAHMSVTNSVSVDIGFDRAGMEEANYRGRTYVNHLGKVAPYPVHGSEKLLIREMRMEKKH